MTSYLIVLWRKDVLHCMQVSCACDVNDDVFCWLTQAGLAPYSAVSAERDLWREGDEHHVGGEWRRGSGETDDVTHTVVSYILLHTCTSVDVWYQMYSTFRVLANTELSMRLLTKASSHSTSTWVTCVYFRYIKPLYHIELYGHVGVRKYNSWSWKWKAWLYCTFRWNFRRLTVKSTCSQQRSTLFRTTFRSRIAMAKSVKEYWNNIVAAQSRNSYSPRLWTLWKIMWTNVPHNKWKMRDWWQLSNGSNLPKYQLVNVM